MSLRDRLLGRRAPEPSPDDADRVKVLDLARQLSEIQARRPELSRDPDVRAALTAIVLRGL
jgi:hypothetical protein